MAEPQSPDEDLDVTLRWPGGPSAARSDAAADPGAGPAPEEPAVMASSGPPRPAEPISRPPVRVRSGGSAVAALRDEVAELRALVEGLAAEIDDLRRG